MLQLCPVPGTWRSMASILRKSGCSHWGQVGSKHAKRATHHVAAIWINSESEGRWDRNRTCTLRLWSARRSVPDCPVQSQNAGSSSTSRGYRPIQSRCVPSHCCHFCCQPPAHPDHLQARYAVLLVCFSCYLMIETERNAQRHLPHFYHHMLKYLTTVADASVSGCAISPSLGHISRLPPPLSPRR